MLAVAKRPVVIRDVLGKVDFDGFFRPASVLALEVCGKGAVILQCYVFGRLGEFGPTPFKATLLSCQFAVKKEKKKVVCVAPIPSRFPRTVFKSIVERIHSPSQVLQSAERTWFPLRLI